MPEVIISTPWVLGATHGDTEMSNKCPPIKEFPIDGKRRQRLLCLSEKFSLEFSCCPQYYVRAPGRVNLIGEHVDYCGYAVFPMAVEQDILIAVATNTSGSLNIRNIDAVYPDFSCNINDFEINKNEPAWFNYVLCGVKGIQDEGCIVGTMSGLDMVVGGNIPPSSGLSSSSALVCAAALAVAHAQSLSLAMDKLAEICAHCETHIGTQGGGMDQAISFLATKDTAKVIEFNPLRATSVTLPAGATFVVANSLAPMNKAANSSFNCRVMECRLATQIMAKQAGLAWREYSKLGQLQKIMGKSLPQMINLVSKTFEPRPYSKEEICEMLRTTSEELDQITLSENTRDIQEFKLHNRALHVFSEAHRVWEFKRVCEEKSDTALEELGKLMLDSHRSTQLLYECSHPKLDALVNLSQGAALGARLTGAGWGGCIVALVKEDAVENYKKMLLEDYYSKEAAADGRNMSSVLFSSRPGSGACIFVQ